MISTPVRVWPEHGSAAPPVHTTGRACIYYDHSSTGQGRRALLRHCHASRISPPGYAHGQDGTTTHRHTPWAGARVLLLPTRKCQVQPLSQTLMSSTQATSRWRARPRPAPLQHGGPVPSLPAARLLADGLTPTRVSHINSETVSRSTSLGLPTSVPVRHSTRLIHSHKPALHTTHPPTGPRAGPNVHISYQ